MSGMSPAAIAASRTNLRGTDGSIDTYYEVQAWGNGRGGIDAEWERFHDAWKESYLQNGYFNNHGARRSYRQRRQWILDTVTAARATASPATAAGTALVPAAGQRGRGNRRSRSRRTAWTVAQPWRPRSRRRPRQQRRTAQRPPNGDGRVAFRCIGNGRVSAAAPATSSALRVARSPRVPILLRRVALDQPAVAAADPLHRRRGPRRRLSCRLCLLIGDDEPAALHGGRGLPSSLTSISGVPIDACPVDLHQRHQRFDIVAQFAAFGRSAIETPARPARRWLRPWRPARRAFARPLRAAFRSSQFDKQQRRHVDDDRRPRHTAHRCVRVCKIHDQRHRQRNGAAASRSAAHFQQASSWRRVASVRFERAGPSSARRRRKHHGRQQSRQEPSNDRQRPKRDEIVARRRETDAGRPDRLFARRRPDYSRPLVFSATRSRA